MDRDALGPVLLVSIAVILLVSIVTAALEGAADVSPVYTEGISNGGMALVLVALLVLFEWLPYERYRENSAAWIATDAVLVFAVAAVVTIAALFGFEAAGLDDIGGDIGPLVLDVSAVVSAIVAFLAAVYVFYDRNRDAFQSPQERASETE